MENYKTIKCCTLLAAVILGISTSTLQAQSIDFQKRLNAENPVKINRRPQEEFEGTHYFNNDWEKGQILLKSGKHSKRMMLKYDMYKNRVEFKRNGRILAIKPKTFNGIKIMHKGELVLFKSGFRSSHYNIKSNQLLQVIYDGKVKLLKQYSVDLNRGSTPDPYSGVIKSYFHTKKNYFLVDRKGNFHEVKLKKDDILGALNTHKSELQAYAKSKNLDFGDEGDLGKILKEYDKMLKK